uniref:Uncharacterized protein n=1 Tax=Musa acuminata subsp. malaccensis TaxID=214687 RepID=A0A804J622_MUSAM|nr:PREDICTED: uncharacterized protein At3g49140-like isoform X1 [Musa acuminata subsp. malaccensis]
MLTMMDFALANGLLPSPLRSPLSLLVGAGRKCYSRGVGGGNQRFFGRGIWDLQHARTKSRVRSGLEDADSLRRNPKPLYHPFEEIEELVASSDDEERRLTDAETARTIIEVNSKAAVMFSGFIDDQVHENIIWPEFPYLTDEQGDIYFEVNKEKEVLQSLVTDDKLVKVIIGLDNIEMLAEMEVLGPSDLEFEVEEISSSEDDIDDESEEQDVMAILDEVDQLLSSENISDWTNLETMQSCHPIYFAKKMEESISNVNLDWMDQPPASIVIQGHLRPAFAEESINIKKLPYAGEFDMDQSLQSGATFYKLEMLNIQIVSAYGNQSTVKIHNFREARPDVLAHSAVNIISRLKAGGEKISQALKLLCIRQKSIHVEEAVVIGVDSLGFDLRICSGRQVQTLRFAFGTQATSEFGAERQLHDLLFPRLQQTWQQAHQGVDSRHI